MSARAADDDGVDELAFLALLGVGLYLTWNYLRQLSPATGPFGTAIGYGSPWGGLQELIPMQLSARGAAFIKGWEGLTLTPKADAGGQEIGYGHKILAGEDYSAGISAGEANALFNQDVAKAESAINARVSVPLSQDQFDALCDLVYEIGTAAFANSTLLTKLNAGDYAGAAAEFPRWVYSQGAINTGMRRRRAADVALFNGGSS